MNPSRLLVLSALALLLGIAIGAGVFWLDWQGFFDEREELPYVFHVGPDPGFDVARDVLRLGQVSPGSRSARNVTVTHDSAERVRVVFVGEGTELLSATPSEAELVNGSVSIRFGAEGSSEVPYGEYTGRVIFIFS